MTVAFLAVAREGLEAALFLIAAATTEEGWAVLIGGLIGLALASILDAWSRWAAGAPMRQFFTVTGLILIVFGRAGVADRPVAAGRGRAGHGLEQRLRPDRLPLADRQHRVGPLPRGHVRLGPPPSIEQVVAYLLFLVMVAGCSCAPQAGLGSAALGPRGSRR